VLRTFAVLLFVPFAALAQQGAPTGSVSGHVYFAGADAPARFATVALQPIAVKPDDRPWKERENDPPIHIYSTLLDGSFQIPKVPAGTYYVVAKYPGYLSPFSQFTNAELVHPAADVQQRIAALLPMVTVTANTAATIDIRLTRGASVSGTVTFDDGTPYAEATVTLMQHGADGKWEEGRLPKEDTADDLGHFRLTGLGPGEYLLRVTLNVNEELVTSILSHADMSSSSYGYSLAYYSGDTARQRDAKPFKLDESQELSGQSLTVPLSKLHSVSGSIIDQRSGRVVNKGTVELLYADDNTQLTSAEVIPDVPGFHFTFVPEGEYLIKVVSAADVKHEEIMNPPGTMPPSHGKDTTLRTYAPSGPQPLVVHGDMQDLNLPVLAIASAPASN
jgi:hypothetical protein